MVNYYHSPVKINVLSLQVENLFFELLFDYLKVIIALLAS